MLPGFARKSVTVERAPYVESRGTSVRDWAHPVPHEVAGCVFHPSDSDTAWTDASQAVTVRGRLWLPPGSDIRADDRVTVDGTRYALDGAPLAWESPTGAVDHIEARLIDWTL